MKRPRNFYLYDPSKEAAQKLRNLADHIEQTSDYAKWSAQVSFWSTAWESGQTTGPAVRGGTFRNRKETQEMIR